MKAQPHLPVSYIFLFPYFCGPKYRLVQSLSQALSGAFDHWLLKCLLLVPLSAPHDAKANGPLLLAGMGRADELLESPGLGTLLSMARDRFMDVCSQQLESELWWRMGCNGAGWTRSAHGCFPAEPL